MTHKILSDQEIYHIAIDWANYKYIYEGKARGHAREGYIAGYNRAVEDMRALINHRLEDLR